MADYSQLEQQYGLPSGLLSAVEQQESGGDPNAVSSAGAQGLFQFMPETAKQYGIDPLDPEQAADGAARMYADLSKKYKGDLPSMLAGYNWGQGNVDRKGLDKAPEETKNYIANITGRLKAAPATGKEYAAADNGIMSDATIDTSAPTKDPDNMSEAELDAILAAHGTGTEDKVDIPQKDPDNMSEAELDAVLAAHGESDTIGLGSADKMIPAKKGSVDDLLLAGETSEQKRQNKVNKIMDDQQAGKISKTGAALEIYGQGVGKETDKIASAVGSVIPDSVKNAAGKGVKLLADTYDPGGVVRGAVGSGIGSAVDYGEENYPVTMGEAGAVGNIAQVLPIGVGMGTAGAIGVSAGKDALIQGIEKGLPKIGEKLIPKSYSTFAADAVADAAGGAKLDARTAKAYDPTAIHADINTSYEEAQKAVQPFYDVVTKLGEGHTANVGNLKSSLQELVAEIKSTPYHPAQSQVAYLEKQIAKLGTAKEIPVNELVELKKNLNSKFRSKDFASDKDMPLVKANSVVDNALSEADKNIPNFGKARTLANRNWLNTVQKPFKDNPVLDKFWQAEDYYAHKGVKDGLLAETPDITKQRADNILKNIKTPAQLNAVRRVLSPEQANILSAAKLKHLRETGGDLSRFGNLVKTVKEVPNLSLSGIRNTLGNVGNVIAPQSTPEAKALLKAVKVPGPTLPNYGPSLKDLLLDIGEPAAATPPVKPPMLQLPPPATITPPPSSYEPKLITHQPLTGDETLVNSSGVARPSTINEANDVKAARQRAENLGLTPDVRRAQVKKAVGDLWDKLDSAQKKQIQAETEAMWKEHKVPLEEMLTAARESAEALTAAKEGKALPAVAQAMKDAGFKKGGLVEPKFSHRQWGEYVQKHGKKHGHTMKHRTDPKANAKAYATLAATNTTELKGKLGRHPSPREVEMAHYIGAHGVHRLLKAKNIEMPAHKMFPAEVTKDHRDIFFNKNKPYTIGHIRSKLA